MPPFFVTLISYGFLLPLAGLGIYFLIHCKKYKENIYLFLIVWSIVHFSLLFLPLNFQRRLTEGLHIPLAILSLIGLYYLAEKCGKRLSLSWQKLVFKNNILKVVLFILLFAMSNFYVITRDVYLFKDQNKYFYHPIEKIQAMTWLKNNTDNQAVILSHAYHGNFIPAWSGRHVYAGHSVETPYFSERKNEVTWYFSSNDQLSDRLKFLAENKITHIFYSDLEKEMGDFEPSKAEFLGLVYENELVEIYVVRF